MDPLSSSPPSPTTFGSALAAALETALAGFLGWAGCFPPAFGGGPFGGTGPFGFGGPTGGVGPFPFPFPFFLAGFAGAAFPAFSFPFPLPLDAFPTIG